ncbi:hypothetical protein BDY21DRAFT_100445 [Lineolata rhizophorae]|uniref:Uncharacterized protein n=1 Tax=Lineolata rhizophorae TaxID=578093 RepID=A0A6A6NSG9_9PEZI|nr:hypothetical protein BDY21DRAFT_100445 [Lineolata rhizophorae]
MPMFPTSSVRLDGILSSFLPVTYPHFHCSRRSSISERCVMKQRNHPTNGRVRWDRKTLIGAFLDEGAPQHDPRVYGNLRPALTTCTPVRNGRRIRRRQNKLSVECKFFGYGVSTGNFVGFGGFSSVCVRQEITDSLYFPFSHSLLAHGGYLQNESLRARKVSLDEQAIGGGLMPRWQTPARNTYRLRDIKKVST